MAATAQRNPIAAFISGEVPLARMFWLRGVVAGLAAGMALGGLGGISPGLQQVWALLMFAYMLAWYLGLWRSAGRYTGPAIWKWAARAVVAMPFVGILLTVALSTGSRTQKASPLPTEQGLRQEAAAQSQQPRKYLSDEEVGFPAKR